MSSEWTVLINAKGSGRNRSWHILMSRHLPRRNEESHAMPSKSDSYRIGIALLLESLFLWVFLLSIALLLRVAEKCELTWNCSTFTGNCSTFTGNCSTFTGNGCWPVFFLISYLYEQSNVSEIFAVTYKFNWCGIWKFSSWTISRLVLFPLCCCLEKMNKINY